MTIFGAIQTAGSGLRTHRVWMDAVADNIANVNTLRPMDQQAFRARYIVAQAVRTDDQQFPGVGGGSQPVAVLFGDPNGRTVYQPGHPYANEQGLVRAPDMDLGDQMVMLMMAQRGYQLNLAVIDRARDSYLQALQINGR